MNTMENINTNINIDEAVEQAMEVVSATPKVNLKKIGVGALVASAIGAAGYGIYRFVKSKKAERAEKTDNSVDNIEVLKRDFLDEEEFEEE